MGTADEDLLHAAALEEFAGTKRGCCNLDKDCHCNMRLHAKIADEPGPVRKMLSQPEALVLLESIVSRHVSCRSG